VENNYYFLYMKIISMPDTVGYVEGHHILPKSMSGDPSMKGDHVVPLSARKHFLAHLLLTKFVVWPSLVKMLHALARTSANGKLNSWQHAIGREARSEALKGMKHSPEFCAAQSARQKGKPSPLKGKKTGKSSHNKGKKASLETRAKQSAAKIGKPSHNKGKKASLENPRETRRLARA
jgi:hypothetical protein